MTAAWSVLLMLVGWLPGNMNAPQQAAIGAQDSLKVSPPAYVSLPDRVERERPVLALERSA